MKTWRDIEELADLPSLQQLIEEEGTPTRIARKLGCSRNSVKTAMEHYGLKSKRLKVGEETKRKLVL